MLTSKTVVLNTPTSIDTNKLYQDLKVKTKQKVTPVHYHHLIFVVHQLNYYTRKYGFCDFDSKAYYQTLGCAPNIIASILLVLSDNNIIKRTRRGNNINEKVSSYIYLETFDFKDEAESDSHIYVTGEKSTPKFINRWVYNNWKMERLDDVVKVKPLPVIKPLTKKQLQLQNEQLQAEIASLKAQLSQSRQNIIDDIPTPVEASFKLVKADNKFNKNKVGELFEYSYGDDKFLVDNWQLLVNDYIYGVDDLKENIAITWADEPFDIGDFIVRKTYNKKQGIYYVNLVK